MRRGSPGYRGGVVGSPVFRIDQTSAADEDLCRVRGAAHGGELSVSRIWARDKGVGVIIQLS